MVRKIGALLLAGVILLGGVFALALAGLLVALATDPFYPFLPFFAPLAIGAIGLAGYLMGKVVARLYPQHPDRKLWQGGAWAAAFVILGLWSYGLYDFFTTPMHWQ